MSKRRLNLRLSLVKRSQRRRRLNASTIAPTKIIHKFRDLTLTIRDRVNPSKCCPRITLRQIMESISIRLMRTQTVIVRKNSLCLRLKVPETSRLTVPLLDSQVARVSKSTKTTSGIRNSCSLWMTKVSSSIRKKGMPAPRTKVKLCRLKSDRWKSRNLSTHKPGCKFREFTPQTTCLPNIAKARIKK